jgi:hypothetical protein
VSRMDWPLGRLSNAVSSGEPTMLRFFSVALALGFIAFFRFLPASAGPPANPTVVSIVPTAVTTDTGILLAPGEKAVVTAAGAWDVCGGACPSGPNGAPGFGAVCLPSDPAGEVLGSLDGGSTFFKIGAGPTVVTGPGELLLGPNDCSIPEDNSGTMTATITRYNASLCLNQTFDRVVTMTSPIYTSFAAGRQLVLAPPTGNATVNLPLAHDSCVIAGSGRLSATVGFGQNTLIGGPDRDALLGGPGNDLLIGGGAPSGQKDTLIGGTGTDTCIGDAAQTVKTSCEK